MNADKDCSADPLFPVTYTLTAEIDVATPDNYIINWYKEGVTAPLASGNLSTFKTCTVVINNAGEAVSKAGNYYYTLRTTATANCPLTSPKVTIQDISSTCNIPKVYPMTDRIAAKPGVITDPFNVTANDCINSENDETTCPGNLRILNFSILSGYHLNEVGTYQPGTPLVITDTAKRTVGVLTLDRAGNLTFQEAPDYPSIKDGGIEEVYFHYTVVNTLTGATAIGRVHITFTQWDYTVHSSCEGYPVRIVFDVDKFLADDFLENDQDPDSKVPVGTINDEYDQKINDAVATRYYLYNSNNGIKISDEAIKNNDPNIDIKRIDVVRTESIEDGGKIIFEFIATTPGIMSCQLRTKDIYAATSDEDDVILQKILVQICPKTATWSGLESDVWQNNNNWVSEGLGAYPTWCTDVTIPGSRIKTTTGGTTSQETLSNLPNVKPGDACKDIVFKMNASIGGIQNLIYRAAYVEYRPPVIGKPGSNGKWTMISMPLKHIYTADFQPDINWSDPGGEWAWAEIKSYSMYFDLAYLNNDKENPDGTTGTTFGSFSKPFANLKQELTGGLGFASNVVLTGGQGTTFTGTGIAGRGDSTFYFPRYKTYGNAKTFEKPGTPFEASNDTLKEANYAYHWDDNGEWITSYPDDPENFNPFTFTGKRGKIVSKTYDSEWNPFFYSTTEIANYYLSYTGNNVPVWSTKSETGSTPVSYGQPATEYLPLTNPLAGQDSRFRFSYEKNAQLGYDTIPDHYGTTDGSFTLTLTGTGKTRIVGNPFMSHLKFDTLYRANNAKIMPYYRIWDGTSFWTHTISEYSGKTGVWAGLGDLTTETDGIIENGYIPPMQAFFVDLRNDNNSSLALTFNTGMSFAITGTSSAGYRLRSQSTTNENLLKIRLKMKGIETVSLLAALPGASDSYLADEDIYKLFSYDKATPEIYTVSSKTAIEINAVSQEGEQKLIPIGIKTSQTGQFEINVEGADNFTAYPYVRLRDALENKYYDLKNQTAFTFNKTSDENLEGRFYILLANTEEITTSANATGNEEAGNISITRENGSIRVYSPVVAIDDFEVYDLSGRILFKDVKINEYSYLWSPRLEQGIYLLKVNAGKDSKIEKFKW